MNSFEAQRVIYSDAQHASALADAQREAEVSLGGPARLVSTREDRLHDAAKNIWVIHVYASFQRDVPETLPADQGGEKPALNARNLNETEL